MIVYVNYNHVNFSSLIMKTARHDLERSGFWIVNVTKSAKIQAVLDRDIYIIIFNIRGLFKIIGFSNIFNGADLSSSVS